MSTAAHGADPFRSGSPGPPSSGVPADRSAGGDGRLEYVFVQDAQEDEDDAAELPETDVVGEPPEPEPEPEPAPSPPPAPTPPPQPADPFASEFFDSPVDGFVAEESATATKIDLPLIEIPQSVSVITRDRLETQNVASVAEALRYTAGVQGEPFGFEPRATFLRIRGFNAFTNAFYRDGLQLRNPAFAIGYNFEPYGLERIEVLKGPASVLYGAGDPAGLVNLVSKRPSPVPFQEFAFETGSFGRAQAQFDLNSPVNREGTLFFRLTGLGRDSDTQVDFVHDNRLYIAPSLTWQPSDDVNLTLLTHYHYDDTRSSQRLPAAGTLFSNPNGVIPTKRFTGEPGVDRYVRDDYAITSLFDYSPASDFTFRQKTRYYGNETDDLTIFASALQPDQRTISRSAFGSDGELDGFTIDNQLQYKLGTGLACHTLLGGVDYQNIGLDSVQTFGAAPTLDIFDPNYGAPVAEPPVFQNNETDQEQLGLYLQDHIKLGDRLVFLLGGRHDWAENKTFNRLTGTETEQDDSAWTGRGGAVYLADNGLAPYFSYTESFLPAIGTDIAGDPFDPERGQQYELGVKYQPDDANSFVTLSLFDLTRENFLQFNPATFFQEQTGEVRSRGIELEAVASYDWGLDLIASYTYLDVEITESIIPTEIGARPTQTPDHSASVWADYTIFGSPRRADRRASRCRCDQRPRLAIGAGLRYLGSTYGDTPNTLKVPAVTLADAALYYDWSDYRFQLNAMNVFDTEYVASAFVAGQPFATYGQRGAVRATLTYRY